MEDNQLREFLGNVRIGDYIWIKYQTIFFKRIKETEGFVLALGPNLIELARGDPFNDNSDSGRIYDSWLDNVIDFRVLQKNNFYNLERKIADNNG